MFGYFVLLAMASLIWSAQGTAVKFLDSHMGPFAITFVTLAGVLGQLLAQLGITWGISLSLACNGAILTLMIPVMTAILASIMLHEKLSLLRIAALAVGLVGVLLMSVPDLRESSFLGGGNMSPGIV